MMALNKKPYKGCRDFFPPEMRLREFLFQKMKFTAAQFGYEPYDGPMLEETELYQAKSGEELINDQIYSFVDRGSREVTIRPEMTPTLARMVANVHKELPKPLRWYSIPNLLRYERPQRGRVREHWQLNVDIFGAPENLGEVEILNFVIDFLKSFGATNQMFCVLLNDRKLVDAVFNKLLKLDEAKSYQLYKVLDKSKKVTQEKRDLMISELLSDSSKKQIFESYLSCSSFDDVKSFIQKHHLHQDCESFISFIELIREMNLCAFISYDPTIVRGLDYYTGIVFEIFDKHPKNNRAISGGGAYANLLQIFDERPMSAVGFGLGDVTLRDFLETHHLLDDYSKVPNDIFLAYTHQDEESDTLKLAQSLRSEQLNVEVQLGKTKFNKIFKLAESKGQNLIGIIEKRDKHKVIQIKDLAKNTTQQFLLSEVDKIKNLVR